MQVGRSLEREVIVVVLFIFVVDVVLLLLYFVFRNNTRLCWGYFARISSIISPVVSSFVKSGVGSGNSDLYRVGILLMIASIVASLPGGIVSILDALP